jgi:hypothetical protein
MSKAPLEDKINEVCTSIAAYMNDEYYDNAVNAIAPIGIYAKTVPALQRIAVIIDENIVCIQRIPGTAAEHSLSYNLILKMLIKAGVTKDTLQTSITTLLGEIAKFLVEKNRAYGNSAAEPLRVFAKGVDAVAQINVRIDDKLSRIARGTEFPGDDTDLDLVGYLILKRVIADATTH